MTFTGHNVSSSSSSSQNVAQNVGSAAHRYRGNELVKKKVPCEVCFELAGIDEVCVSFAKSVGRELFVAMCSLLRDDPTIDTSKLADVAALSPKVVRGRMIWGASLKDKILENLEKKFILPEDLELPPAWVERMAATIKKRKEHCESAAPVDSMVFPGLRPFQQEGIDFAIRAGGRCIIGDEMGLGKTVQALGVAYYYRHEIDTWPVLVVCPSSLRYVWEQEAENWINPQLRRTEAKSITVQCITKGTEKVDPAADFVVVSFDHVAAAAHLQKRHDGRSYGMVIVDEAHYIKDQQSKGAQAVMKIAKEAKKCVLATGRNKNSELYALLDVVLEKGSLPSFIEYIKRYAHFEQKNFGDRAVLQWTGVKRPGELHLMTQACMIRRSRRDVLTQLPEKTRQKVNLGRDLLDKKKMKELANVLEKAGTDLENFNPDAGGGSGNVAVTNMFKLTAEAKGPAVLSYIGDLLENSQENKKFLLFAHHWFMLDILEEELKKKKIGYMRIDASTPQESRQGLAQEFQTNGAVRIALLSIAACGVGLTLTASRHVVFAELCGVPGPGQMQQAEDLVRIIGQRNAVTVRYLCAPDTVDDKMFKMLDRKTRDTTGILNGKIEEMKLKNISDHSVMAHALAPKRRKIGNSPGGVVDQVLNQAASTSGTMNPPPVPNQFGQTGSSEFGQTRSSQFGQTVSGQSVQPGNLDQFSPQQGAGSGQLGKSQRASSQSSRQPGDERSRLATSSRAGLAEPLPKCAAAALPLMTQKAAEAAERRGSRERRRGARGLKSAARAVADIRRAVACGL